MRRLLRAAGVGVGVLLLAALCGAAYVEASWRRDYSATPLPAITASTDPEVVARGEYLVNAVAHCGHCHSADAPAPGVLSGGPVVDAGPFGRYWPGNLTADAETGLGQVTDGQVARAIRSAVLHDGTFAPIMLVATGPMADEDLAAVVAYLRTLPAVSRAAPPEEWGFVAKALSGRFGPREAEAPAWVAPGGVSAERGAYLANGPAACAVCHTARDPMRAFAPSGPLLAGEPHPHPDPTDPTYEIVAPNLTPDPATGSLAAWDEERFVARFRAGRVYRGSNMPWESFAGLTDNDLRSLWRYLRSLPPVVSDVGPVRRPG